MTMAAHSLFPLVDKDSPMTHLHRLRPWHRWPALLGLGACLPALAHEGHGLEGASHYHATDVWGFVVMAALMAVVWWFTGRGK